MTLLEIFEMLFIGPLKLIFEMIFLFVNDAIGHPGWAIVALSITINILLLPLYKKADSMQEKVQQKEQELRDGVAHIKEAFCGDERMMILQTYYRQNQYRPTDSLKGTVSLLLEIPFFMAAYQFLSGLTLLEGVSFGGISDLGNPDGLLHLGDVYINILPILMTLINVVSSIIYLKGTNGKTKVQLYVAACIFLMLLYESPSGLVFYWTLNNVFSLGKNIIFKMAPTKMHLCILASLIGILFEVIGCIVLYMGENFALGDWVSRIGLLLQLPILCMAIKSKLKMSYKNEQVQASRKQFLSAMFFLTVLIGILIPSSYISASPMEYVDISYFYNPLWYIVCSFCMAAGIFLIWMNIFYHLASLKWKLIFEMMTWIASCIMLINYMFFGRELGVISSNLQYKNGLQFSMQEQLINWMVCIGGILLCYLIGRRKRAVIAMLYVANVALVIMSTMNIGLIKKSIDKIESSAGIQRDNMPVLQFSKEGYNVVVFMLDRAMNVYVPYIFNENSELKEQFEGFTYYSNTISFANCTNMGIPALLGGYEYTPVEMNKRENESLVSKHNEALKVMPVIFRENGYDVTVCNPIYANYQWIPDLAIYDDCSGIKAYNTVGNFVDDNQKKEIIRNNKRNFFRFAFMKTVPVSCQTFIYDGGKYNKIYEKGELVYDNQVCYNRSQAEGISYDFMENYNVLLNLSNITTINEGSQSNFLFIANDLPHQPMLLQEPEYVPSIQVNNTDYDLMHEARFELDGRKINVNNISQMAHYHANMATFIQLGKWFDYLRENDVYDNTRIILVSDHGAGLENFEELIVEDGTEKQLDVCAFCPLLMVKDFGADEFVTSSEFMTNADVPVLAMEDIIQEPINPFTNKEINSDEKFAHEQYIITAHNWDILINNGNTFLPSEWISVKDNIWEKDNWKFSEEIVVLKEYELP